jgi:3-isopropylmalate/(R)-2-methylmalate dehydratase large subunit
VQERFTKQQGVKLYGEVQRGGETVGSEGICHNIVIEEIALPGQVVVGTDSHTCMAGALGCFAFGVGSTDMANSWFTKDVRVRVPETARVNLRGSMRPGVCAKDVMLELLSREFFKKGHGIGRVLEFGGPGLAALALDERATLTNMAVEAGGFTGIIEADDVVLDYLVQARGRAKAELAGMVVKADPGASYVTTFDLDLAAIVPMVATPGDPRNGIPLGELAGPVEIDLAYGGSCTGGRRRTWTCMPPSCARRSRRAARSPRA